MHVFMMTYDDVIDKQNLLASCNASLRTYIDQLKLALEAE